MATITSFEPVRRTHPWGTWANGKPYRLTAGKEFGGTPVAFRQSLYRYARQHDRTVRVAIKGEAVEFQFSRKSRKK